MAGIGKTTLADAVFQRQWQSSKFEACCFLANVREKSEKTDGLNDLRNTLVHELLKDKYVNINTPSIPANNILIRLRRTKALIVLDDVNARKQLEYLVGDDDRFCQGSRIIITARDKGLLLEQKVDPEKIYNVEGLGSDEALQLFHSHAFHGNKSPTIDYNEFLSREVVDYVKGNPLALKVMGSLFRRCTSKQEWEAQWNKLKRFPNEDIDRVLRISYDGLGIHEQEIFLDIACFLCLQEGHERKYVKELLDSRDFHGEAGINHLIDRSLISISKGGRIEMHNFVRQMGRGDGHVQAISFDLSKIEMLRLELEHASFEKMHQLRSLRVCNNRPVIGSLDLPNSLRYLEWSAYPLKSLPSKFSAQNLVVLSMSGSEVGGQLWNQDQAKAMLQCICRLDASTTSKLVMVKATKSTICSLKMSLQIASSDSLEVVLWWYNNEFEVVEGA
ncbi:TMV resistance protein N-like [Prunus avium]|uniref:TMV resistance protein N-like n=1 Tax=Prunus avium TaxID=42229 RepID=A0A6P5SAU6_PRUAV|nr:TMV resistance protein N-like [Prunus avium]